VDQLSVEIDTTLVSSDSVSAGDIVLNKDSTTGSSGSLTADKVTTNYLDVTTQQVNSL